MRKSVKRVIAVTATAAVLGAAGTAAYAAWIAKGEGNAYAKAGQAQDLKITEATTAATLYPGATGDSVIKIKNPNSYPVEINTIKWTPSDGVTATPLSGSTCINTGIYFGDFSTGTIGSDGLLSGLALQLGAGETKTFKLTDSVRMINNSEDGCQGATFSIPVKVTGASAAK
ncbi:hypothetical protein GCM10010435_46380 [Winogradskya consettensis]|uniref:Ribosomally synthesized peptide with SipW-like signal peptide n=1 Tax=Winogradskya consettensis TaxID=113560 RepID=A0A919T138_9ACTN|nr:hypothetical protein [Actinoplanes consettensis]GIM83065.1 hypothetical protein Aco04nite_84760 [Actinoplanes consettensis]